MKKNKLLYHTAMYLVWSSIIAAVVFYFIKNDHASMVAKVSFATVVSGLLGFLLYSLVRAINGTI